MLQWFIRNIENIESCAVTVGVVAALIQYLCSSRHEKKLRVIQLKKIAVDYAGHYKNIILPMIETVVIVFKNTGITDILKDIHYYHLQDFTSAELNKLLSSEKRSKINEIYCSDEFAKTLLFVNIKNDFLDLAKVNELIKIKNPASDEEKNKIEQELVISQFHALLTNLCNELEFFALHFTTDIASEEVVYQSLHQTYLEGVRLVYFVICNSNSGFEHEKYFTNLIKLYKIWLIRTATRHREEIRTHERRHP